MDVAAIAAMAPVVPVLTIERVADAAPLARALVRGGLPVLEVTLRTPAALEAISVIAREVDGAVVGVGTVLDARQLDDALRAGARFAVSPGCTRALAEAVLARNVPFLPGVQTVSEALEAAALGFGVMKFFPAEAAGGVGWLKSAAAPLAGVRFCPTGGIAADNAETYLRLSNVVCVGGSWVAPNDVVAKGDWQRIEQLARTAAALKRR